MASHYPEFCAAPAGAASSRCHLPLADQAHQVIESLALNQNVLACGFSGLLCLPCANGVDQIAVLLHGLTDSIAHLQLQPSVGLESVFEGDGLLNQVLRESFTRC